MKRIADGQSMLKSARTDNEVPLARVLKLQSDLIILILPRHTVSKWNHSKKNRGDRKNLKTRNNDHNRKYDVTTELSNVLSGLNFGQLLHGDDFDTKKELSRILASRSGNTFFVPAAAENIGRQVLKVAEVNFRGLRRTCCLTIDQFRTYCQINSRTVSRSSFISRISA